MTKRFFAALFLTAVLSMSAAATSVSPAAASEKPILQYSVCKSCGAEAVQQEETRYGKWIMRERLLASTRVAEIHIRMRSRSDWSFIRQSAKNAESARQR